MRHENYALASELQPLTLVQYGPACPVACDMSCYFCSSQSLEICQCQRHIHRLAVGLMEFLDIDGHRWPKWDALGPLESCPFLPIYTNSMQREETYRKVRMYTIYDLQCTSTFAVKQVANSKLQKGTPWKIY